MYVSNVKISTDPVVVDTVYCDADGNWNVLSKKAFAPPATLWDINNENFWFEPVGMFVNVSKLALADDETALNTNALPKFKSSDAVWDTAVTVTILPLTLPVTPNEPLIIADPV